jgi:hypothetical protein
MTQNKTFVNGKPHATRTINHLSASCLGVVLVYLSFYPVINASFVTSSNSLQFFHKPCPHGFNIIPLQQNLFPIIKLPTPANHTLQYSWHVILAAFKSYSFVHVFCCDKFPSHIHNGIYLLQEIYQSHLFLVSCIDDVFLPQCHFQ